MGRRNWETSSHSTINSPALAANAAGTSRPGPTAVIQREARSATAIDTNADTMTMRGSADTSKVDRNRASRVAFAAIWKAIMAAAVTTAATTAVLVARSAELNGLSSRDPLN